jgi:hypothetical protein
VQAKGSLLLLAWYTYRHRCSSKLQIQNATLRTVVGYNLKANANIKKGKLSDDYQAYQSRPLSGRALPKCRAGMFQQPNPCTERNPAEPGDTKRTMQATRSWCLIRARPCDLSREIYETCIRRVQAPWPRIFRSVCLLISNYSRA